MQRTDCIIVAFVRFDAFRSVMGREGRFCVCNNGFSKQQGKKQKKINKSDTREVSRLWIFALVPMLLRCCPLALLWTVSPAKRVEKKLPNDMKHTLELVSGAKKSWESIKAHLIIFSPYDGALSVLWCRSMLLFCCLHESNFLPSPRKMPASMMIFSVCLNCCVYSPGS